VTLTQYLALALAGVCLLVALWMLLVEPRRFRIRRVALPAGRLPALRILHLTDTHFHGHDGAILAFLQRLAEREKPDLVLWTGDLIDTPDGIPGLAQAVRFFSPALGSYAVLGGHDYRQIAAMSAYVNLLTGRANGVRLLDDASCRVSGPEGGEFAIVGLRDAFEFEPDYEAAWAGVGPDVPVLVIAHSPDVVQEAVRRGADVAFFGHTHGGQVRFPVVGALVTHTSLPRQMAWGTFRLGGMSFVVSSGLGVSPPTPYRLLCRPEAVVAELQRS